MGDCAGGGARVLESIADNGAGVHCGPLDAGQASGRLTVDAQSAAINAAVADAERQARGAMAAALRAGHLLNRAKDLVEHGQWEAWVQANCKVAPRTARAYMRLAAKLPLLPADEQRRVADLPVREAVRAIGTSPDAPPRSVRYVLRSSTDSERLHSALDGAREAMRKLKREALPHFPIKAARVESLRSKLMAAVEALDRIAEGGGA